MRQRLWYYKDDQSELLKNFHKGEVLKKENLEFQRPCPKDAIIPNDLRKFLGKKLNRNLKRGSHLKKTYFK